VCDDNDASPSHIRVEERLFSRQLKNVICCVGLHDRSLRRPQGRLIRARLAAFHLIVFEQPGEL